jgi:hypothetical protein
LENSSAGTQLDFNIDENDISRITRIHDEFDYWIRLASSNGITEVEMKKANNIN